LFPAALFSVKKSTNKIEEKTVSISERQKEIRRRRKRRSSYAEMKAKLAKSPDAALKEKFAGKLRKMTPGADGLIEEWGLQ
jgi:hypothetical protein